MITPSVGGEHAGRLRFELLALFGIGSLGAATSVAVLVFAAGSPARALGHEPLLLGIATLGLICLQLVRPHSVPTLRLRQTARNWRYRLGWRRAALLWGIDIGSVLSTRVNYTTTYVVLLATLLASTMPIAIGIMTAYAFGRLSMLLIGPMIARRIPVGEALVSELMRGQSRWRLVHLVVMLILAVGWLVGPWRG